MPYRPKDIYRGRRKFRVPLNILLFVLAFLILGSVTMFYVLQRYMVYDASGATLRLPFGQEEAAGPGVSTPEPTFEPVQVQVIWEDPDFEEIDLGGREELEPTVGWFVPERSVVSQAELASAVATVRDGNYTTAVLEMKDRSGQLAWPSTCATALECSTFGSTDVTWAIQELHDAGKTVTAQISCFCDSLLVQRNWSTALQKGTGGLYVDENDYMWVDPYNNTVRTYITDLCRELAALGFDEIVLADLYHPISDSGFTYTVVLQTEADPVIAVCQAGRRVAEALDGSGTAVSARLDTNSLRQGLAAQTGQDVTVFWRLFARLYCPTTIDMVSSDRETASASMEEGSADARFVPVTGYVPEGCPSYVLSSSQ